MNQPLVSVLVPVWNEAADISGCIDALAAQDYLLERIEVLLVDGGSTDGTPTVVERRLANHPFARAAMLDNPRRRTSTSLNVGLDAATGDVVVRVDARSRVEPHYVRTCVELLSARAAVGVVGGAQVARARSDRPVDRGIARALRNRWATGLSRYRRSTCSGPADTVWMGAFRTHELRALGGWSGDVALNEDWDLNCRYRSRGMVVWFDASLQSRYLPRPSLTALGRQHFYFGRVKGTWWARGRRPSARQLGLLLLPPVGAAVLAATARRGGLGAGAALLGAVLLVVDGAGQRGGDAAPRERVSASAAMSVIAASWWVGVLVGVVGERVGVRHRHG